MILSAMMLLTAAPEAPAEAKKKTVVQEIHIHRHGDGKSDKDRNVTVIRSGPGGAPMVLAGCDDGRKFETEADTARDGKTEKTRIMICAKGGESDVSWVQRLRDAAKRIEGNNDMAPETKARVLAALNEAIAKAPAQE